MPKKIKKRIPKNKTQGDHKSMDRKEVKEDMYKIPKEQFITITFSESSLGAGNILISEDTFINGNFTLMTIEGIINLLRDGLEGRNKDFTYKKPPESSSEMSIKLFYAVNDTGHDQIGIMHSTFPCDAQAIMTLNLAYQIITQEVAKAEAKLIQPAGPGNVPPIGKGRA